MKCIDTRMWVRLSAEARTVGLKGCVELSPENRRGKKVMHKDGNDRKGNTWTCCTREQYLVATFILKHS
jgi:hypothetical protein